MKSMFSYHFCEKYGEQQSHYLNVNCYNYNKKNQQQVQRLVHSLQKAISVPSQYAYINHSANMHHNVPLWVATNALTFGQISKMYQYATTDLRTKNKQEFYQYFRKAVAPICYNNCTMQKCMCPMESASFHSVYMETIPDTLLHKKLQISPRKTEAINMGSRTYLLS